MRDELDEEDIPTLQDTVTADEKEGLGQRAAGDVGPLVAPGGDEGEDDEAAAVASESDSDQVLSAEEAAMHVVDEP